MDNVENNMGKEGVSRTEQGFVSYKNRVGLRGNWTTLSAFQTRSPEGRWSILLVAPLSLDAPFQFPLLEKKKRKRKSEQLHNNQHHRFDFD